MSFTGFSIGFSKERRTLSSQEVVTPVPVLRSSSATEGGKTGVQRIRNELKTLDSGFRRNDGKRFFSTFYEFIKIDGFVKSPVHPSIPQGERIIKTVSV